MIKLGVLIVSDMDYDGEVHSALLWRQESNRVTRGKTHHRVGVKHPIKISQSWNCSGATFSALFYPSNSMWVVHDK